MLCEVHVDLVVLQHHKLMFAQDLPDNKMRVLLSGQPEQNITGASKAPRNSDRSHSTDTVDTVCDHGVDRPQHTLLETETGHHVCGIDGALNVVVVLETRHSTDNGLMKSQVPGLGPVVSEHRYE